MNGERSETMNLPRFIVGTYSKGEGDLFTLWLDREKAALLPGPVYTGLENPSFLAADGENLYAVSERLSGGAVASFRITRDGTLTQTALQNAPYPALCHACVWPGREAVSFASYMGGGALTVALNPDGSLGEPAQWLPNVGKSVNPERQEQPYVHSLTPDKAGKFVVEADLGTDRLRVFRREGARLAPHADVPVPPGEGPRHFTFDAGGQHAYLITEMGCRVLLYDYDNAAGALAYRAAYGLLAGHEPASRTAADIHLSPDGLHLYASVRGATHLIRFRVELGGALCERAFLPCGASAVRNFCLDSTGGFLLAADQHADEVRLFRLNPADGEMSACLCSARVPAPVCVLEA